MPTTKLGPLPSASAETEPCAAAAVDIPTPPGSSEWSEALCARGNLVGQVFRQLGVFRKRFYGINGLISS